MPQKSGITATTTTAVYFNAENVKCALANNGENIKQKKISKT